MGTKRKNSSHFQQMCRRVIHGDGKIFILNQFFFSFFFQFTDLIVYSSTKYVLCESLQCSFRFETWWMTCCCYCCCCGCGFRSKNKNKLWKLTLGPWLLTSIPVFQLMMSQIFQLLPKTETRKIIVIAKKFNS